MEREEKASALSPLLEVRNLHTEFRTGAGIVPAVDGISYTIERGETIAIVGESGSGKTAGALSILRLIPDPPGRITRGEILFAGVEFATAVGRGNPPGPGLGYRHDLPGADDLAEPRPYTVRRSPKLVEASRGRWRTTQKRRRGACRTSRHRRPVAAPASSTSASGGTRQRV